MVTTSHIFEFSHRSHNRTHRKACQLSLWMIWRSPVCSNSMDILNPVVETPDIFNTSDEVIFGAVTDTKRAQEVAKVAMTKSATQKMTSMLVLNQACSPSDMHALKRYI